MKALHSAWIAAFLMATGPVTEPLQAAENKPSVWDRGCGDDDGNDRCSEKVQRKMRGLYGLDPVEQFAKKGKSVRRTMFVDGYGNDLLAISFIQSADGSAQVELRLPCAGSPHCTPPLLAPASAASWDSVARLPIGLENGKPGAARTSDGEIAICLHSWVVVIEAVDQDLKRAGQLATENSCADGPAVPYASAMADQALANLPDCSALKPDEFRNIPSLLAICTSLRGDRRAAGEAYSLARQLEHRGTQEGTALDELFIRSALGRVNDLRAALKSDYLKFDRIEGTDRDHARISGSIHRYSADGEQKRIAKLELEFVREDGRMKIARYRLGPFKVVPDED